MNTFCKCIGHDTEPSLTDNNVVRERPSGYHEIVRARADCPDCEGTGHSIDSVAREWSKRLANAEPETLTGFMSLRSSGYKKASKRRWT